MALPGFKLQTNLQLPRRCELFLGNKLPQRLPHPLVWPPRLYKFHTMYDIPTLHPSLFASS